MFALATRWRWSGEECDFCTTLAPPGGQCKLQIIISVTFLWSLTFLLYKANKKSLGDLPVIEYRGRFNMIVLVFINFKAPWWPMCAINHRIFLLKINIDPSPMRTTSKIFLGFDFQWVVGLPRYHLLSIFSDYVHTAEPSGGHIAN